MNFSITETPWLQYIQDIANIRLSVELIRDDINFENNGGHIIYAVDTNIIFLYAEPLDRKNYAKTFNDEDENILKASAISLGDFIFFNGLVSTKGDCLLLPTELQEEYMDCCCSIYERSINEKGEANNPEVVDEINDKIKKINNSPNEKYLKQELIDYLVNDCPNLVQYLHDEDYTTARSAIDRLAKLNDDKKILGIENNTVLDGYNPDIAEVEKLARIWYEKIKAVKYELKKSSSSRRIRSDAKALAQIALFNEYLKDTNPLIRLYYISADEAIYEFAKSKEFNQILSSDFIRHPAQYVNCLRFTNESSTEDKLDRLDKIQAPIDGFLKPFSNIESNNESQYLKNLREIVNKKPNAKAQPMIQNVIEAFKIVDPKAEKYEALKKERMELLALRSMSKALELPALAETLTQKLHEVGINELLNTRRNETYSKVTKMSLTFGVIGFTTDYLKHIEKFYIPSDPNKLPRGPVSLKREIDKTRGVAFFDEVHNLALTRKWIELFKLVNGESDYIKHLIYALLAADAGHWSRAQLCCKSALKAAEESAANESIINRTHEAYYLLSVALRHDCHNIDDYKEATLMREKGLSLWKDRYGCDDLRFESEKLASEIAYFNCKRFMTGRLFNIENEPKIRKTWENLLDLEKKINISNEPPLICSRIKRQVYTNLCCLFIFDQQFSQERNIKEEEGRNVFIELQKLSENKSFRASYFIKFLLAFLTWHFASDREKFNAWENAYQQTDKASKVSTLLLPYEKEKFSHYRKYLIEHRRDWN